MEKPKIAVYWLSSCGGCDEAIIDLEEDFLQFADKAEFVFWPCAMDFKFSDLEKFSDSEITLSLINGSIQNSEQLEKVKLLRSKSRLVAALGSCAAWGGVVSLANLSNKSDIFKRAYLDSPALVNPDKLIPLEHTNMDGRQFHLPEFFKTVRKLDEVIAVDYYIPGCAPTKDVILSALEKMLSHNPPESGRVLLPDKSVCFSCKRNDSKPEKILLKDLKRIHQIIADENLCFFAQDVICMGPATRDGCGYLCLKGNMPCTGCFGPLANSDQGAGMIGMIGSILAGDDPESIDKQIANIHDPAGTFYMYSLASSPLGRSRKEDE